MKKADKEYFNANITIDIVLKVGNDYFKPSEAVKAKRMSIKRGLLIEILKRTELVEKSTSRKNKK